MIPKLTEEQLIAVQQQGGRPVAMVDPSTQEIFYLMSGNQFDQVRCLLESHAFDVRETYPAQDSALGTVWNEPELGVYDEPDDAAEE